MELAPHSESVSANEQLDQKIGLLVTVLAVFLAIVSMLGSKEESTEIVHRVLASNTWAQYQAKKIRAVQTDLTKDILEAQKASPPIFVQQKLKQYETEIARYKTELNEIGQNAKNHESIAEAAEQRGDHYDVAEILLQIGLVLCSITLLLKKKRYAQLGLSLAFAGLVLSLMTWLALI